MPLRLFDYFVPQRLEPTYFGIRLDNDPVWLPGTPDGTDYGHVQGRVVLCINEPTIVSNIKLHLEGRYYINLDPEFPKISHQHHKAPWKEVTFFHQLSNLLPSPRRCSSVVLDPDNYEFCFEMCIPKGMPESIEGIDDCFIHYNLRAQVYSSNGADLNISRKIQVRKAYTMSLPQVPSAIIYDWPEKITYNVGVPNQAVPFDSDISINFRFIPLLKDLNLGTIESRLIEKHHVTKPFSTTRSREVLVDKYVPPNWDNWDIVSSDDESSHFWYHCSRVLHLPKSTRHCLQSATSTVIQVEHQIEIVITLLNPDSHVSSIRFSLPIFLYFRPPNSTSFSTLPGSDISDGPLPHYDSHVHDMKPQELGLSNSPTFADIQYQSGIDQSEEPPQYSALCSSDIPSYCAAIR